ncbi:type II toxin-antitoxin system VapC family toxin [Nanoarchaeota archaeon]
MIGLDTSAIIDIFKGEESIRRFLEKNKEPLATNMMSYIEVFFGIDPESPQHAEESGLYEEFFNSTYFIDMSKEASRKASAIYYDLKRSGKPIGKFDCLLASCFLASGVKKVVTRNVKHFQRVKGLKVIEY